MGTYEVTLSWVEDKNGSGAWPFDLLETGRIRVVKLRRVSGQAFADNEWESRTADRHIAWRGSGAPPRLVIADVRYRRWTLIDIAGLTSLLGAVAGLVVALTALASVDTGRDDDAPTKQDMKKAQTELEAAKQAKAKSEARNEELRTQLEECASDLSRAIKSEEACQRAAERRHKIQ